MRPREAARAKSLDHRLQKYASSLRPLPGIEEEAHREAFVGQLIESIRRIEFVHALRKQKLSPKRADPSDPLFDPLRAAVLHQQTGATEEAYWMVFLFVHFGKHLRTGWRLARDVYGGLGKKRWTWAVVSAEPQRFAKWLHANEAVLRANGGMFGNHRKYETLKGNSDRGLPAVVASYVGWVAPPRTHQALVASALSGVAHDPRKAFLELYRSMEAVLSFGRTARFDYLTMLGKLGLANIEPGSAFITGATGPLRGGRLLFGGSLEAEISAKKVDKEIATLGAFLGVGMQVMEDAICNWQKSPERFTPFRG